VTSFKGISDRSAGASPDALALKLTGSTGLELDLARGMEVEVTIRGIITGHAFDDERDKNGDIVRTVKAAKVKADELVEVNVIPRRARNVPQGQTRMTDDGDVEDATSGEIVDATIVAELGPGERPEGVDEDGVITEEPRPDDEPPATPEEEGEEEIDRAPHRHPQVPEEAWAQLNHEQQRDVLARVDRQERLLEYLSGASAPADREVAETKLEEVLGSLRDDYAIELIPADEVVEEDERVAPASEPPPPPVTAQSPPLTRAQLERRRSYLLSKRALPPEMEQARDEELTEIDQRVKALGKVA
jgi:hypothetical protein